MARHYGWPRRICISGFSPRCRRARPARGDGEDTLRGCGGGRSGLPREGARGTARWPARANSCAPCSPSNRPGANDGTGSSAGRRKTLARVAVYVRLRTGLGATAFTGPRRSGSTTHRARTSSTSSMPIQGTHWRPPPSGPPRPALKSGRSSRSIPPAGDWTMPFRTCTTRSPASAAGAVAASQSRRDRPGSRHRVRCLR